jgi:hypothetical protein
MPFPTRREDPFSTNVIEADCRHAKILAREEPI